MNRNAGALLAPLVALALFAIVAAQTLGALHASGAWSGRVRTIATPSSPLDEVDAVLLRTVPPLPATPLRDPFEFGSAPAPTGPVAPRAHKVVAPPAPERPVLTAIVWDADPRALVRWQGQSYTVRSGGLFDEFQVVSITRDQVTLSRGGETIVLQRKPQGD